MADLAASCAADHLHVTDLPYRLSSWALDEPENASLWFDENQQLVAWAVLQTPFWTVDIVCHPALAIQLHPQILTWADQRARFIANTSYGHPAWYIMAFSSQASLIRDLEEAGFQSQADVGEDSWSKVLMERSGQKPVEVHQPPPGYIVRSLAGESEVDKYVELHRSVFESKNMTVEWRMRTLLHPAYKPGLDIVVEAPGGQLAAFCICWLNEKTGTGQVEPMGCRAEFRGLGLGRVAFSTGLHRLQQLKAKNIFVEADNYRDAAFKLYASVGFDLLHNVLVFRKDY
jgi:hypothetical protein